MKNIRKTLIIHAVKYYAAVKINELLPHEYGRMPVIY